MIKEILKRLTEIADPGPARPNISLNPKTGFLEIALIYEGKWYNMVLNEGEQELNQGPALVAMIVKLLPPRQPAPGAIEPPEARSA